MTTGNSIHNKDWETITQLVEKKQEKRTGWHTLGSIDNIIQMEHIKWYKEHLEMNETNESVNVDTSSTVTTETNVNGKFYTDEEIQMIEQKAGDKRISQYQKKVDKMVADKVNEATKLSQMSAQEKYEYELQQREKEVAEKERALALAEMKNTTAKILSEKGLPLSLLDMVVNEDGEITNANINALDKAFKDSVKAEVEKRLSSRTPTKSLTMDKTITREQFGKLTYSELMQLKNEQPELYAELSNLNY